MKISIYLISSNDYLSNAYSSLSLSQKVKPEWKEKFRGYEFSFKKFNLIRNECFCDVIDKKDELILVLLQAELAYSIAEVRTALFVCYLREQNDENNAEYLMAEINRALINLYTFKKIMDESKNLQALMLPIRNFSAPVVNELPDNFALHSMQNEFRVWLEQAVAAIRSRRSPKKSKYDDPNVKYFKDDNDVHFEFGHENHGQFATNEVAHKKSCEINGLFRFGYRIKKTQQFNLTKSGASISMATIVDCHDSVGEVKNASHVNMFANDYYTIKYK